MLEWVGARQRRASTKDVSLEGKISNPYVADRLFLTCTYTQESDMIIDWGDLETMRTTKLNLQR